MHYHQMLDTYELYTVLIYNLLSRIEMKNILDNSSPILSIANLTRGLDLHRFCFKLKFVREYVTIGRCRRTEDDPDRERRTYSCFLPEWKIWGVEEEEPAVRGTWSHRRSEQQEETRSGNSQNAWRLYIRFIPMAQPSNIISSVFGNCYRLERR